MGDAIGDDGARWMGHETGPGEMRSRRQLVSVAIGEGRGTPTICPARLSSRLASRRRGWWDAEGGKDADGNGMEAGGQVRVDWDTVDNTYGRSLS